MGESGRAPDVGRRNQIKAESHVHILLAEGDIYVARVAHRLTLKLGPRFEMPRALLPMEPEWRLAAAGNDYAVWERVEGLDFNVGELNQQVNFYQKQQQQQQQQRQSQDEGQDQGQGQSESQDVDVVVEEGEVEEEEEEEEEGIDRPVLLGGDPFEAWASLFTPQLSLNSSCFTVHNQ